MNPHKAPRPILAREEWLRACLTRITAGWPAGADLPENTRISVGFPLKVRGQPNKVSEHYRPADSTGGMFEIFISPTIAESREVALAVAIEAARIATGRAPTAGEIEALKERSRAVVEKLPVYPHAALNVSAAPVPGPAGARPGSRLMKVSCEECSYTARVTRKWLKVAVPACPSGHGIMRVTAP